MTKAIQLGSLCALLLISLSCEREKRQVYQNPELNELAMGGAQNPDIAPGPAARPPVSQKPLNPVGPYDERAFEIARGQELYINMNCLGCHAMGGGGMGPPLMDDEWLYGSDPKNIYISIVEGRANGMPSYRGKMTGRQVWQLVSYVRSMSGQLRKDVSPGRTDSMQVKKPELAKEKETPIPQRPGAEQKEQQR
jgi:cytochrome c oxidase cbb3-type subunit III